MKVSAKLPSISSSNFSLSERGKKTKYKVKENEDKAPLILPKAEKIYTTEVVNFISDKTAEISTDAVAVKDSGDVMIRFNHYKKTFPVVNGIIESSLIDAEYYITFAYPNCKIHLSKYGPSDFSYEAESTEKPLEQETPPGTFINLRTDIVYFIVVEEDDAEKTAYEERQVTFETVLDLSSFLFSDFAI
jgi:hypothetical protein